jgi:hypothetical protein
MIELNKSCQWQLLLFLPKFSDEKQTFFLHFLDFHDESDSGVFHAGFGR